MMRVRLTQIDGKLPNLALMALSHWHKSRGDEVIFTRRLRRNLFDGHYDKVYGSAIFSFSAERVELLRREFPGAIIGGTGADQSLTVEQITGEDSPRYDYSIYPDFEASIGFTQRGCRLKCGFCVVPKKEGRNRSASTINEIWRGKGHARKLHLLDNDFFGQAEDDWRARIAEIRAGQFRVCFSQGINVRLITPEAAEAIASVEYRDSKFARRRVYTAWDNLRDEEVFFRGIDLLERAGVPPSHVMAYMLVGYDRRETHDRIMHRFERMVERGVLPYPMVYDRANRELCDFQRWAVTGLYRALPFKDYCRNLKRKAA